MTIDAGGQLLFLFGFGLVVLALTWAGATYSWDSAYVLAPLCIGAALVGVFGYYEKLMAPDGLLSRRWPFQKAMVPLEADRQPRCGPHVLHHFLYGSGHVLRKSKTIASATGAALLTV